jgi:O-acetylserine/cysteine efflux transporter
MASVVMQTQAFFTLLLAGPLLGERAKPWQWWGLLLAFGGLMTIGLAHGEGPGQMTLAGFVLTLGAAFMWAVSNLVARRAAQVGAYAPFSFIVWSSVVPIVPFFALAVWTDGSSGVVAQLQAIDGTALLAVGYLAILATLLAYTLWTQLLQRHAAGRVTPFSLLVPVVGLWAAYAFLGETPAPLQWAGAAAVLCGLVVNQAGGGCGRGALRKIAFFPQRKHGGRQRGFAGGGPVFCLSRMWGAQPVVGGAARRSGAGARR